MIMKPNNDLLRKILITIQEQSKPGEDLIFDFKIDGYDIATIAEHCELLYEKGFIRRFVPNRGGGRIQDFFVGNLTAEGHEFLARIKENEEWEKIETNFKGIHMNTSQDQDISPAEQLARDFELWQKDYYDDVDAPFSRQDESMGFMAYKVWDQGFFSFLEESVPSLAPIYRDTIRIQNMAIHHDETIHQAWKKSKGRRIEDFLTQAIKSARAGRLTPKPKPSLSAVPSTTSRRVGKKIFIGHGRSHVWRVLKDFLQDQLHQEWDEFNREPTAGYTTVERLKTMLDDASFAFLVMTAEDEHADKTVHARENVIHEAGLFQGRLGFPKAIILLEEGCEAFSNVAGLTHISFPKGNIEAVFEKVRQVLYREGIIRGGAW
jgi:predicted nucleotide-binding protein